MVFRYVCFQGEVEKGEGKREEERWMNKDKGRKGKMVERKERK